MESAREAAELAVEKIVATAGAARETLMAAAARAPKPRMSHALRLGALFVGLSGAAEANAQHCEKAELAFSLPGKAAIIENKLECLYKLDPILEHQVWQLEQAVAQGQEDTDWSWEEYWDEKERKSEYKMKAALSRGLDARIARLEQKQDEIGVKWADKRERRGQTVDLVRRANNETEEVMQSWGVTMRGNQLIIPQLDGTYMYISAEHMVKDVAFFHRGNRMTVVFETTANDHVAVLIQQDRGSGKGIYQGQFLSDEKGNPLSTE